VVAGAGGPVHSLGGLGSTGHVIKRTPAWYRAMQGTALGDDTLDAMKVDAQWKSDLLAGQRELIAAQRKWAQGDSFQKWIAIGATLAIPLSAAVWRALGIGRRRRP
jgi:hypothetical protein